MKDTRRDYRGDKTNRGERRDRRDLKEARRIVRRKEVKRETIGRVAAIDGGY